MRFDARQIFAPLVAILVLALMLGLTAVAIRSAGVWQGRPKPGTIRADDPYALLDRELALTTAQSVVGEVRDPSGYGSVRTPVTANATPRPVIVTPPPAPRPVLTSIIWDADPRATIRYDGKDISVRENSLFADFRVSSITSTQVVLERGGEPMVLTLRPKGE